MRGSRSTIPFATPRSTGGAPQTPTSPPPAGDFPDETNTYLAMVSAFGASNGIIMSAEIEGLAQNTAGTTPVTTAADPVRYVGNQLDDLATNAIPTTDEGNTGAPTYQLRSTKPVIRAVNPIHPAQGTQQALLMPVHISSTSGHGVLVVAPQNASTTEQTLWQQKQGRIVWRNGAFQFRLLSSVYHSFPGTFTLDDIRALEWKWDEGAGTLGLRANGEDWTTISGIASGAWQTNADSRLFQSSYFGGDYLGNPGDFELSRIAVRDGATWSDVEAESPRAWVATDFDLAGLDPDAPAPPPPPGDPLVELPPALRTVNVSNNTEVTAALADQQAGDRIRLADGTYSGDRTITITAGTEANPVIITAANKHAAIITGQWNVTGDHARLYWLRFQVGSRVEWENGDDGWIIRCQFIGVTGDNIRIRDRCDNGKVIFNYFENWGSPGWSNRGFSLVTAEAEPPYSGYSRGWYVAYNYFKNQAADDGPAIAFGSTRYDSIRYLDCIAEYNLIENSRGQATYLKSSGNVSQFNTYRRTNGSYSSQVSACQSRSGQDNDIIGNASINGAGIFVRGIGHRVLGNYKDDSVGPGTRTSHVAPVGNVLQEDYFASGSSPLQPRADTCLFSGNIGYLYIGGGSSSETGAVYAARNTTIENHTGSIIIDTNDLAGGSGARSVGTVDNRNSASSVPIPDYVILNPADVGPDATYRTSEVTAAQLFPNPYNSRSAHHRRIGTGAAYASATSAQSGYVGVDVFDAWGAAGIGTINGANGNQFGVCFEISEDADPSRTVTGGGAGLPYTAKMPNDFPFYSNSVSFGEATNLQEDFTLNDLYNHMRSADGSTRTADLRRSHDIRGTGHAASFADTTRYGSSAAGCSTVFGTIRKFEIETPGLVIGHAHHIVLPRGVSGHSNPQGLSKFVQIPARYVDSTAHNAGENLGPIPYGGLVAIPEADLAGVLAAIDAISTATFSGSAFGDVSASEAAAKEAWKRFATACCHYGCYAIDGGNTPQFRADLPFTGTLAQALIVIMRQSFWWSSFKLVTNSVTGANLQITSTEGVYSGDNIGTFVGGDIAGGGTGLAPNTALIL